MFESLKLAVFLVSMCFKCQGNASRTRLCFVGLNALQLLTNPNIKIMTLRKKANRKSGLEIMNTWLSFSRCLLL